jgi:uncharacterized protein
MSAETDASPRPPGQSASPFAFHVIAKPAGPQCNLACAYCFYRDKTQLYPETRRFVMDEGVLESFIRQYVEAQDVPVVSFTWQGGEPTLLGLDYFRRVVALQRRYASGKRIENALQTNGILLDDAWAEFLAAERFLVGVSIDGPDALHDRLRVDHGGRATRARVEAAIALLQKHRAEVNTLTCVQRENGAHPLEVYRFLRDLGVRHMQFIPVVERAADGAPGVEHQVRGAPTRVASWSVGPEQYGRFLCAVFDEWVRRDVGRVFVQSFEVALGAWMGQESSLCLFRPTCGLALAVEHNGDLYACDHFVDRAHLLGNLTRTPLRTLVESQAQGAFGRGKLVLPQRCHTCEVRFACHGGCPKDRFVAVAGDQTLASYFCPSYELFFEHVDPYMRYMADELTCQRSAASVMEWARGQRRSTLTKARPERNALCPCGSGRKYRVCCGR